MKINYHDKEFWKTKILYSNIHTVFKNIYMIMNLESKVVTKNAYLN